jgi:bla regulator protein BlaR1
MNTSSIWIDAGMDWLWRSSWQAAVLAGLILLIQRLLGARLTPAWRHNLWLLVLLRLALPALPESGLSIFNLVPFRDATSSAASIESVAELALAEPGLPVEPSQTQSPPDRATQMDTSVLATPVAQFTPSTPPLPLPASPPLPTRADSTWHWWIAWLFGATLFLARVLIQSFRFARRLKADGRPANPDTLGLLDQ